MKIKIVNRSHHPLPQYETGASAGMDLRAFLSEAIVLKPQERRQTGEREASGIPAAIKEIVNVFIHLL